MKETRILVERKGHIRAFYIPGEGSTSGWTFREFGKNLSLKRKGSGNTSSGVFVKEGKKSKQREQRSRLRKKKRKGRTAFLLNMECTGGLLLKRINEQIWVDSLLAAVGKDTYVDDG